MEDNNQPIEGGGILGLDVGTSRIVVAAGPEPHQAQSQLNAFVSVPYSKMTETILQQNQMVFHRNGKDLFVYGNESERFASFFNTEPRRPMSHGVLNAQELMGQQMIQAIIEQVVPKAHNREVLCYSIPGKGEGADANLVYHEAVLKTMLTGLGYNAKAINEGLAVVFAELQSENFTGIGISCGGGMCNVCVSFLSVPMLSFSVPKGAITLMPASPPWPTNPARVSDSSKKKSWTFRASPKTKCIARCIFIMMTSCIHSSRV